MMDVGLQITLSDVSVDAAQSVSQRQLALSIAAVPPGESLLSAPTDSSRGAPLNLCLILDHSGSMAGRPIDSVRRAASRLLDRLSLGDRITLIGFNHKAKTLVPNQILENPASVKLQIDQLKAGGGTAIDEGLRLGMRELGKGKQGSISQIFLLTDGENEHGDNDRCMSLAALAAQQNLTLNALGFGDAWNQDVLEKIADAGGGALAYIEHPEQAIEEFGRLFSRIRSVGLTNAHLILSLMPGVRLAELKPIAQVAPDTIELPIAQTADQIVVRIGDLMVNSPKIVLANLYLPQQTVGRQAIAQLHIRYDNPTASQEGLLSEAYSVYADYVSPFQPNPDPQVQQYILAIAKYRQTQLAEQKLKQGDLTGAATMLQTAAKTALQMGDQGAATVLQGSATRLQQGTGLTEANLKKTRIVSKTTLQ